MRDCQIGGRSGAVLPEPVCYPAPRTVFSEKETMPVSPRQMREALARRLAASQADDERAAAAARASLPGLVDLLVREFGATRVVLYGSLVTGLFRADSDIDLAVTGVPAERFMTALGRVRELAGRRVDLVDLDWAEASLQQVIARRGEVLHVAG